MVEIALAWATVPEVAPEATRGEVRDWLCQLGLPTDAVPERFSPARAFREIGAATSFPYTDEAGTAHLVTLSEDGRDTPSFQLRTLYARPVQDPQAPPVRVGQVKLLLPQHNTLGPVPNSHAVQLVVGSTAPGMQRAAARGWFERFQAQFQQRENAVGVNSLRTIVRDCFIEAGVPVRRRLSLWFVYGQALPVLANLHEFLQCLGTGGEVATVMLRDHPREAAVMAESADAHFFDQLTRLENSIDYFSDKLPSATMRQRIDVLRADLTRTRLLIEYHQSQLSHPLALAGLLADQVGEKLNRLDSRARLRKVTGR